MKFDSSFVEKLMSDRSLKFRLVGVKDILFHNNEEAGEESIGNIARVAENTAFPLEIVLTTAGNYKLFDKQGKMVKFLDKKYHTLEEIIYYIKRL